MILPFFVTFVFFRGNLGFWLRLSGENRSRSAPRTPTRDSEFFFAICHRLFAIPLQNTPQPIHKSITPLR
jgi:hypothetical protein